jgi:hypothetical protein
MRQKFELVLFLLAMAFACLPARSQDEQSREWSCDELRVKVEDALKNAGSYWQSGPYCSALRQLEGGTTRTCGKMAFAYYKLLIKERGGCQASGLVQAQLSNLNGDRAFKFGDVYHFNSVISYKLAQFGLLPVPEEERAATARAWYLNANNNDGRFALAFEMNRAKKYRDALSEYERSESKDGLGKFSYFMIGRMYLASSYDFPRNERLAVDAFGRGGELSGDCWAAYMHGALVGKGVEGQIPDLGMAERILDWALSCARYNDGALSSIVRSDLEQLRQLRRDPAGRGRFNPSCLENTVKRLPEKKLEIKCKK